jgi:hypothetical protein
MITPSFLAAVRAMLDECRQHYVELKLDPDEPWVGDDHPTLAEIEGELLYDGDDRLTDAELDVIHQTIDALYELRQRALMQRVKPDV